MSFLLWKDKQMNAWLRWFTDSHATVVNLIRPMTYELCSWGWLMIHVWYSSSLQTVFTTWEPCTESSLWTIKLCLLNSVTLYFNLKNNCLEPTCFNFCCAPPSSFFDLLDLPLPLLIIIMIIHYWSLDIWKLCNQKKKNLEMALLISNFRFLLLLYGFGLLDCDFFFQICPATIKGSSCSTGDSTNLVPTCFQIGSVGTESWTGRSMLCCSSGLLITFWALSALWLCQKLNSLLYLCEYVLCNILRMAVLNAYQFQ